MKMEQYSETEICLENIMRRIDAENRLADRLMDTWEKGICVQTGGQEGERKRGRKVGDEIVNERKEGGVNGTKKRKEKEKTGEEMRRLRKEKMELRKRKKAIAEGRKMVREGKMKTLDRYY